MCMSMVQVASMNIFYSCRNWKNLYFIQAYRYSEVVLNHHVFAFFKTSVLKEVRILCPLSPQYHYNDNIRGSK